MAIEIREIPDPKEEPGCVSTILGGIALIIFAACGGFKSCGNENNSADTSSTIQNETIKTEITKPSIKNTRPSTPPETTDPFSSSYPEVTPFTEEGYIEDEPMFNDALNIESSNESTKIEAVPELTKKEQRKAEREARREARRKKRGQNN